MNKKSNEERLKILEEIFSKKINQQGVVENEIIFGLPLITNSFKWLMKECALLPYSIYCIQCKNFTSNNAFKLLYKNIDSSNNKKNTHEHNSMNKSNGNTRIFSIMATIGVDKLILQPILKKNIIYQYIRSPRRERPLIISSIINVTFCEPTSVKTFF